MVVAKIGVRKLVEATPRYEESNGEFWPKSGLSLLFSHIFASFHGYFQALGRRTRNMSSACSHLL